jgi:hypothetical protein
LWCHWQADAFSADAAQQRPSESVKGLENSLNRACAISHGRKGQVDWNHQDLKLVINTVPFYINKEDTLDDKDDYYYQASRRHEP